MVTGVLAEIQDQPVTELPGSTSIISFQIASKVNSSVSLRLGEELVPCVLHSVEMDESH